MTEPANEILEHLLWLKGVFPDHSIYEIIHRAVETVNPSLMADTYTWDNSPREPTQNQKSLISDYMLAESLRKLREISQSF
jgi:hypothetical protein